MAHWIAPHPDASQEHLAILGGLREAIDDKAKLSVLIDLRASFKPHRAWQSEQQYLINRHRSPLLSKLLASLETSGVPLRDALTVPLWFVMNAR